VVIIILNMLVRVMQNIKDQEYLKYIMSKGSYFGSKWTLYNLVDKYSNTLRQSKIVQCSSMHVLNIFSVLTFSVTLSF